MRNVSIEFHSNDTAKLRPIPDVYTSYNLTSPVWLQAGIKADILCYFLYVSGEYNTDRNRCQFYTSV